MKKSAFGSFISILIVVLSYFFFKGCETGWSVLFAAIPAVLLTAGVIHSHIRIIKDKCSKTSAWIYGFEIIFPFIWVAACSVAGLLPLTTLAAFLTLPIAIACAQSMKNSLTSSDIYKDLGARTANLQVLFSLLLTAAFVVGKFIC